MTSFKRIDEISRNIAVLPVLTTWFNITGNKSYHSIIEMFVYAPITIFQLAQLHKLPNTNVFISYYIVWCSDTNKQFVARVTFITYKSENLHLYISVPSKHNPMQQDNTHKLESTRIKHKNTHGNIQGMLVQVHYSDVARRSKRLKSPET